MTDHAMAFHLRYNHYPRISESVIATCREAIEAVNDSDPDRKISYRDQEAQAWAIVEVLHLEDFLEMSGPFDPLPRQAVISRPTSEGDDEASR